ncbi:MarR family winged helix-turn-helix transcriptional regulator [Streptomycetaceae bacterium NBC_01309]
MIDDRNTTPGTGASPDDGDEAWLAALVPPLRDLVRAARDERLLERVGRQARADVPTHLVLALTRIGDFQPIRLSDLADQMGIGRTTLSRQVTDLVAAGLVTRTPDPRDARAATLGLTASGATALRDIWQAWAQLLGGATASWSPADRDVLPLLLERLAQALSAMADS